ncbi:hypothetical protein [Ulvibacterium sp.]|uniref:hypothetical protein n=1 Tax=Ulvibacterium sp. TaxID=2665914 RepID=UPI003BA93119
MKKELFLVIFLLMYISMFATEKELGATSSGRWVKIARIQNQNPIGGSECSSFSGSLNIQTDYGQSGTQQYYAIFSFGSRGGIKPLLQEFGDAASRPVTDPSRIEWRVYTDAQGWHYLWFWQSNYSHYALFDYKRTCATEHWTYEEPPTGYTQVWSSLDGQRQDSSQSVESLSVNESMGIGTTNIGSYRLAVKGKIRAEEVKVETGWADYVFAEGYDLPTLEEVERHIREKGHLINIPSAAKVQANGIDLGEMNKLLLEKIEEQMLYILQLEKRILKLEN